MPYVGSIWQKLLPWIGGDGRTGFSGAGRPAQDWVGSAGTVDPNSTNLVKYIKDLTDIEFRIFAARFLDNGDGHVFLALRQLNMNTGVVTTLMTFDSNLSPPSTSYQLGNTPGNPKFNFTWADEEFFSPADSVYYVEAQLSRTASGGQAGLAGFSIKKIVP